MKIWTVSSDDETGHDLLVEAETTYELMVLMADLAAQGLPPINYVKNEVGPNSSLALPIPVMDYSLDPWLKYDPRESTTDDELHLVLHPAKDGAKPLLKVSRPKR